MAAVDLIKVCKEVGSTKILHDIQLKIHKGEFIVVVGPSGCGKSTLLRLIAGLDDLSSGQILINNECVNHIPAAKRDIAMVFQQYALYPHMTVFNNMAYALKMRKLKQDEIRARVLDAANLLQLGPFLERKPQALSGGQRQRVAMGRAIVRSPALFLFDEPLSNLDAKLRTDMRHEIKKLHQQLETTCLYVTHDQTEAMTMAQRIMILNHGQVEQIGTPQELYQHPASFFVAGFTGHYPMNFIKGIFDKAANLIQTELMTYPAPACVQKLEDKTGIILAIRPEHVRLSNKKNPEAIAIRIEFVDDMGADKLIQALCIKNGNRLSLRVLSDTPLSGNPLYVDLAQMKRHLFHQKTGKRIGEWCE